MLVGFAWDNEALTKYYKTSQEIAIDQLNGSKNLNDYLAYKECIILHQEHLERYNPLYGKFPPPFHPKVPEMAHLCHIQGFPEIAYIPSPIT